MTNLLDLIASSNVTGLLAGPALRAAALLTVGLAVTAMLRRASADVRHLAWAVVVTAVLVSPLISLLIPSWRVLPTAFVSADRPAIRENLAAAPAAVFGPASSARVADELRVAWNESMQTVPPAREEPLNAVGTDQMLLLIWLSGVLLVLASIAVGFMRVYTMTRRARRIADREVLASIAEVSAQLRVGSVLALEGSAASMPMTCGVLRPRLLLPANMRYWSPAELQAVLRHELAHVRRRDPLWQLLAEVMCALHWFNPLAWYAARRMRIEREHACDDAVLNGGSRASDYAAQLLHVARSLRSARATSLAAIAMARPGQLEGRLLAVLDEKRARKTVERRWPAWLAAVVVVAPVATASPKLPSQPSHKDKYAVVKEEPAETEVVFAQPRLAGASVAAVKLSQNPPCPSNGRGNNSISSNSNDEQQQIKWEAGGCKGRMSIRGKIRFSGDFSGIESISRDGDFRLWLNDGHQVRVVTARPNGNSVAYEYTVDGKQRAWLPEGRDWFASIMIYVVRATGFAVDERVDYLLKQQGPNGVLAEVEAIGSDYVQRIYLQKLMSKAQLTVAQLQAMLVMAKRTIASDHELAELLIAVAGKYQFNDAVRTEFIDATTTLQSDYEHRRTLSAALTKGGLSSENVAAMLQSSRDIASNYEKAELLVSVVDRYQLDPAMRAAYLQSARSLESDYEKGRVFKALLKQGAASPAETAELLTSLATMSSDYERAEVLRLLPASALANPTAQEAYLKLIVRMKSDYEVRRALMGLLQAGKLTSGGVSMVVDASSRMESDYEQAELLLALIGAYRLSDGQRQSVTLVVDEMKSDYERGRVSSALLHQMAAPPPPPPQPRN